MISIIIPIYNEEGTIKQVLDEVYETDFGMDKEVIVVNDEIILNVQSEGKIKEVILYPKEIKTFTFEDDRFNCSIWEVTGFYEA